MKQQNILKQLGIVILLMVFTVNFASSQITYDQQQKVQEYFDNNNKIWGFSKQVLDEVFSEHKTFFGNYADALLVIDLANKFANAQDKALLETIVIEISKKGMEKVFPTMASALNWASWAKTGLELLDQFVVNPARIGSSLNDYYDKREKGWDRGDAISTVRDWGNVLWNLKKDFRKQYGDAAFEEITPSTLRLVPRWRNRFDRFVESYFEAEYVKYKVKKEIQEVLKKRQKEANKGDSQIYKWLKKKQEELDKKNKCEKNEYYNEDEKECECLKGFTENSSEDCVKIKNCSANEHFDADEEDCECNKGFTENDKGECVKQKKCDNNKHWDAPKGDCICDDGYDKNDQGVCEKEDTGDMCSMSHLRSLVGNIDALVADIKFDESKLLSYVSKFNKEVNDQSSDPCENSIIAYCYYNASEIAARMSEKVSEVHDMTIEVVMLQGMCPDLDKESQAEGLTIKSLVSRISGIASYKGKIAQMESRLGENGCDKDEVAEEGENIVPPETDPGFISDGGTSTEMPGDGDDNDGDGQQDEEPQGLSGYNVTLVLYDSGNLKDDVFNLSVSGRGNLGQTPAGGLRSYGLNLPPGTYTATVTVVSAPDDFGTYTLSVVYNGSSIGSIKGQPPQGSSATLSFTVPAEEE